MKEWHPMTAENHVIIFLILYCFCLKLSPSLFFKFILIGVFILIITSNYVPSLLSKIKKKKDVPFQFLEYEVKWIRRELRLLRAFSEDVRGVSKSREEIDMIASQLWDSEIKPEKAELLNPTEAGWIEHIDYLKFLADSVFKRFQVYNERRQFDKWYFLSHNHNAFFDEMKQIKKEIRSHLEDKSVVDICGTLERSRAHIQSLQDRLQSTSFKEQNSAAAALISSILKKENKKRHSVDGMEEKIQIIELQLSLLLAFLRDLKGLDFQSETEKAWVEEAVEIIEEAQCAIETFIQRTEGHKLMEDINDGLLEFLNRKERYCLKFNRRYPSKSVTCAVVSLSHVKVNKQYWFHQMQECFSGEYHQVQMLCEQLDKMDRLFKEANAIEGVDYSRKAWLDQMNETATKAVHTIEAYIRTEGGKEKGTYTLNSLFDNRIISERTQAAKLSEENERMSKVIHVLERSIRLYRIEIRKESTSVVGLEEDIHGLSSRLTNDGKLIVSIVGMRGIGKTTLAKKVFNRTASSNHFHSCRWVSLPPMSFGNTLSNDDEKLVLGVLETLEEQNGGSWIEKIHHFLGKERNLLVLDNISKKEIWDTLKVAFPEGTNGSKIMLTTRHKSVASDADQSSTQHLLRLRTKEESWKLFTLMVHLPPEISPESEKIIKAKVVERCGGLPLAILRLGYHLIVKHVTKKDNFSGELESESIKHYKKPWKEAVANEKLSDQLMKCLAYIGLFPRDYEIPARRVIASWVAEEVVQVQQRAEDSPECVAEEVVQQRAVSPECVAEMCLDELINRYIIQVLERKLDGKIKTFCLTNALREESEDRLQNGSSDQRLADKFERRTETFEIIHGELKDSSKLQNYKDLVAFLSFDVREGNKPGEDIGNFLHRGIATGCFRLLKVLDLERVFRPILPKSIGNLNDLKYLGLRWTYLEEIPPSIGNLLNLQTLDVKHTYVRILPKSIWKLQKLLHLYLSQSHRSKFESQPKASSLNNLETLWGLFLDDVSAIKNGLNKLKNLTKLGLTFELELPEQEKVESWVKDLTNLKSLRLRSIDEKGDAQNLRVMDLSKLEKLSSLYLFGSFGTQHYLFKNYPPHLSDLTLSASGLVDDPMPILGKLSKLKSLCFYFGSYKGNEMSWKGFPNLLVLKLWKLESLEELKVEAGAMQKLKELDIRCCNKLKVPTGLKHLRSLQELKLTNMPKDFTIIQDKKWEIWGDIACSPRITVEYW